MKTHIKVINIPTDIYQNVENNYTLEENIDIKVGETLEITDNIYRIVYGEIEVVNGVSYRPCHREILGNDQDLSFKVIAIKHFIDRENYYDKIINIEFTNDTINKIRNIINIDNNVKDIQL